MQNIMCKITIFFFKLPTSPTIIVWTSSIRNVPIQQLHVPLPLVSRSFSPIAHETALGSKMSFATVAILSNRQTTLARHSFSLSLSLFFPHFYWEHSISVRNVYCLIITVRDRYIDNSAVTIEGDYWFTKKK